MSRKTHKFRFPVAFQIALFAALIIATVAVWASRSDDSTSADGGPTVHDVVRDLSDKFLQSEDLSEVCSEEVTTTHDGVSAQHQLSADSEFPDELVDVIEARGAIFDEHELIHVTPSTVVLISWDRTPDREWRTVDLLGEVIEVHYLIDGSSGVERWAIGHEVSFYHCEEHS